MDWHHNDVDARHTHTHTQTHTHTCPQQYSQNECVCVCVCRVESSHTALNWKSHTRNLMGVRERRRPTNKLKSRRIREQERERERGGERGRGRVGERESGREREWERWRAGERESERERERERGRERTLLLKTVKTSSRLLIIARLLVNQRHTQGCLHLVSMDIYAIDIRSTLIFLFFNCFITGEDAQCSSHHFWGS